jgi:hypothetical protein
MAIEAITPLVRKSIEPTGTIREDNNLVTNSINAQKNIKETKSPKKVHQPNNPYGAYNNNSNSTANKNDKFRLDMSLYLKNINSLIDTSSYDLASEYLVGLLDNIDLSVNNPTVIEFYRVLDFVNRNINDGSIDDSDNKFRVMGVVETLIAGFETKI